MVPARSWLLVSVGLFCLALNPLFGVVTGLTLLVFGMPAAPPDLEKVIAVPAGGRHSADPGAQTRPSRPGGLWVC